MIHGGAPRAWLEFSANLNPLGTPADVVRAIAAASYTAYGDMDATEAVEHLARECGVEPANVLLTAGATEGIRLAARAFAGHRASIVVGPTYGEYARAATLGGVRADEIRAEHHPFDPPFGVALRWLRQRASLAWICDPNNPTGRGLRADELRAIVASAGEGSLIVLDQSFAPFAPPTVSASELVANGRVVLVRSLTKLLAIPGVRVGYVIAAPAHIDALRGCQDPWSVGAHALAAARAASCALSSDERGTVGTWRDRLVRALGALGWEVVPSDANFVLVRPPCDVPSLVAALATRRIAVRDCASFGLERYVRLAVRPPAEQDELLDAIATVNVA